MLHIIARNLVWVTLRMGRIYSFLPFFLDMLNTEYYIAFLFAHYYISKLLAHSFHFISKTFQSKDFHMHFVDKDTNGQGILNNT